MAAQGVTGAAGGAGALTQYQRDLMKQLDAFKALDKRKFFYSPVPREKYPDYAEKIKNPISFEDIQRKIETDKYEDGHHLFQSDLMLVFTNALEYNQATTSKIRSDASRLLLRASRIVPPALQDAMEKIVRDLITLDERDLSEIPGPVFKGRVTEEIAPKYFSVVARPMCFDDIVRNLASNVYVNLGALRHDVELVFLNCQVYNNAQTPYHSRAIFFLGLLDEVFARHASDALLGPSTALPLPVPPGVRRRRHETSLQQALRSALARVRDADSFDILSKLPVDPSFNTLLQNVARPAGPMVRPGIPGGHNNPRPADLLTQIMIFADRLRLWTDSRPDVLNKDSLAPALATELAAHLLSQALKLKVRLFERKEAEPLPNGRPRGPELTGLPPCSYQPPVRHAGGKKSSKKRPRE